MRRIEAITFDLDGTLLDNSGVQRAVVQTCEEVAATQPGLDAVELQRQNDAAFAAYWPEAEKLWSQLGVSGDGVSAEIWRRTLAACGLEDEAQVTSVNDVFIRHMVANLALYEDARPVLEAVKRRYTTALITNGPSDLQRRALRTVGIELEFDAVIVSGEAGIVKPDEAIFRLAADALGKTPEALLHVGDNAMADVAGAKRAGYAAAWLDRGGRFEATEGQGADLRISDLRELLTALELT